MGKELTLPSPISPVLAESITAEHTRCTWVLETTIEIFRRVIVCVCVCKRGVGRGPSVILNTILSFRFVSFLRRPTQPTWTLSTRSSFPYSLPMNLSFVAPWTPIPLTFTHVSPRTPTSSKAETTWSCLQGRTMAFTSKNSHAGRPPATRWIQNPSLAARRGQPSVLRGVRGSEREETSRRALLLRAGASAFPTSPPSFSSWSSIPSWIHSAPRLASPRLQRTETLSDLKLILVPFRFFGSPSSIFFSAEMLLLVLPGGSFGRGTRTSLLD